MEQQPGAGRPRGARAPVRPAMAAMIAAALATTGCQGMAKTPEREPSQGAVRIDNTVADWPLKFVQHSFGARCYSTYGCTVDYNGFRHVQDPDDVLQPSSDEVHPDAFQNANAGYVGVMNFPPPARVRWRSRDGAQHEALVDIAEIFSDGLLLHNVPREDVREGVSILNPAIVLEVNDRTVNVYMRARIPTKSLRVEGNPHSDYRRDMVLAWSRTY
jgi:hypothetical protein